MEDFLNTEDFEESAFAAWFSSLEPTAQAEYIEHLNRAASQLKRQGARLAYCAPALDYWVIDFWDHQALLMDAATAAIEVATFVAGTAKSSGSDGCEEKKAALLASSRLPSSIWLSLVGVIVLSHAALDKWIETILEVLLIEDELSRWMREHPGARFGPDEFKGLAPKAREVILKARCSPADQARWICQLLGLPFDLDNEVRRAWDDERRRVRNQLAHGPRSYARPLSTGPIMPTLVSNEMLVGLEDYESVRSVSAYVMVWMIRTLEKAKLLLPFEDEMLNALQQSAQEGRPYWFGRNRRTDGLL